MIGSSNYKLGNHFIRMSNSPRGIVYEFIDVQEHDMPGVFTYYCKLCKQLFDRGQISTIREGPSRWHRSKSGSFNVFRANKHVKTVHSEDIRVVEGYRLRPLTTNERQRRFQRSIDEDHPVIVKVQFPQHPGTQQAFIRSIVQFICQSGSSFSIISNSYFRQMFTSFCDNVPIFTRHEFVENELRKVYEATKSLVKDSLGAYIQSGGKLKLQLDGWEGPMRKKYVNVVIWTDTKYFYWNSLVLSSNLNEHETGNIIAKYVKDIINHFHEDNIIAFGTDNASNMRNSWDRLAFEFDQSTIFFYSCAAHALNIFAEEVIVYARFKPVFKAVCAVVALMRNNSFLEFYLEAKNTPFKFMIPTYKEVRWCSTFAK